MEKAKVYFTDFRVPAYGEGTAVKLKQLIKKAGIGEIDMDGKFVAIKMRRAGEPQLSAAQLRPGRGGRGKGPGGQALPHGLQHPLSRQPKKRIRAFGMCMGKRLYPPYRRLPHHHCRRS